MLDYLAIADDPSNNFEPSSAQQPTQTIDPTMLDHLGVEHSLPSTFELDSFNSVDSVIIDPNLLNKLGIAGRL